MLAVIAGRLVCRVKGIDSCCLCQKGSKVWATGSCDLEGGGEVWSVGTIQAFLPHLLSLFIVHGLSSASRHEDGYWGNQAQMAST